MRPTAEDLIIKAINNRDMAEFERLIKIIQQNLDPEEGHIGAFRI